jgi:heme/copper-type cytochrome/quinol oxidase subunit 2
LKEKHQKDNKQKEEVHNLYIDIVVVVIFVIVIIFIFIFAASQPNNLLQVMMTDSLSEPL